MCVSCVSTAEQVAAGAVAGAAALRHPVHVALAAVGVVPPPDPVGRDARTVGFLRALDLDPVDILGADAVARADDWTPPVRQTRLARWLRPIGSQSLLSAQ